MSVRRGFYHGAPCLEGRFVIEWGVQTGIRHDGGQAMLLKKDKSRFTDRTPDELSGVKKIKGYGLIQSSAIRKRIAPYLTGD